MLTGVAFCPQAPALVPDLGRGLDAELAPVREACRAAIRRVANAGARLVVVGSADEAGEFGPTSRGTFAGWGLDLEIALGSEEPGPVELPPSLTVGAWLVRDALGAHSGATGLTVPGRALQLPETAPTALIVMGEGSARRTEKAPGYFDERAVEYDRRLSHALATGEGCQLNGPLIDDDAEDDLLVAGDAVRDWVASETEAQDPWNAVLHYEGAPFGVGYFVASWVHPMSHEDMLRTAAEQRRRDAEIMADIRAGRVTVRIVG